ncbi:hypothetical protein [Halobacillus sp. A5]|uniref:hypothetical protein n=1 Tax=Halobacillus sp. A5 TaxID=2880263 RepID=UPI0020A6355C|nr:hypothetical protein [Halobacillus sp. A5]MCP3025944.1 hypothetical protein [Halobacillus sp. A5]
MKKLTFIISIIISLLIFLCKPKKVVTPSYVHPPFYPGTNIPIGPGDLLFSPIGKSESKYVGHVGIVDCNHQVVHSIPAGLVKDSVPAYHNKFRFITVYAPIELQHGENAAAHLNTIYERDSKASYKISTALGSKDNEQYCTKIVWQCYKFGAGINLGGLSSKAKAVHPSLIKHSSFLYKKGAIN